jgi:hypothetical protein
MSTETTSPFANLFLKVMDRLKTAVPELRYIDQDLGQLENYGDRPPVAWPCALLEVDEFDFSDVGSHNTQTCDGFLIVRLAVPAYSNSSNITPKNVTLKGLEYYALEQKIHEALHGWRADGFSKLLRRKSKLEQRNDAIRVRVIPYAVSFEDETTKPVRTAVPRPDSTIGTDITS